MGSSCHLADIRDGGVTPTQALLDGEQVLLDQVGRLGERLAELGGRKLAQALLHSILEGCCLGHLPGSELGADHEIVEEGGILVLGRLFALQQEFLGRVIDHLRIAEGDQAKHQPAHQGLGLPLFKGGHAHVEAIPEIHLLPDIGALRDVQRSHLAAHQFQEEPLGVVVFRHVVAEAFVEGSEHDVAFVDQSRQLGCLGPGQQGIAHVRELLRDLHVELLHLAQFAHVGSDAHGHRDDHRNLLGLEGAALERGFSLDGCLAAVGRHQDGGGNDFVDIRTRIDSFDDGTAVHGEVLQFQAQVQDRIADRLFLALAEPLQRLGHVLESNLHRVRSRTSDLVLPLVPCEQGHLQARVGDGELVFVVLGLLLGHRNALRALDDRIGLDVADLHPQTLVEAVERQTLFDLAFPALDGLFGRNEQVTAVHFAGLSLLDLLIREAVEEIDTVRPLLVRADLGDAEGLVLVILQRGLDGGVLAEPFYVEVDGILALMPGHAGDVVLAELDAHVVLDLEDDIVAQYPGGPFEDKDDRTLRGDRGHAVRHRDLDPADTVFVGHPGAKQLDVVSLDDPDGLGEVAPVDLFSVCGQLLDPCADDPRLIPHAERVAEFLVEDHLVGAGLPGLFFGFVRTIAAFLLFLFLPLLEDPVDDDASADCGDGPPEDGRRNLGVPEFAGLVIRLGLIIIDGIVSDELVVVVLLVPFGGSETVPCAHGELFAADGDDQLGIAVGHELVHVHVGPRIPDQQAALVAGCTPTEVIGIVLRCPSVLDGRDHDGAPDHFQSRVSLRIVVAVDRDPECQVLFVTELDFLGRIFPQDFHTAGVDGLMFGEALPVRFPGRRVFRVTLGQGSLVQDPVAVGIGGGDGQGEQAAEGQEEKAFHGAWLTWLWDSVGGYSRGRSRNLPWGHRLGYGQTVC